MRIALAQLGSEPGDVDANVSIHCEFIEHAITREADLVVFPELSITGYEPSLARERMREFTAWQLTEFQRLSDSASIAVWFGAPTVGEASPRISIVAIRPHQLPSCYSKMHLHDDELPFFESGTGYTDLIKSEPRIGIAICYELSIPIHIETVFNHGARLLVASVAKTTRGLANAVPQLKQIATKKRCPVLMVNAIGRSDNFISGGNTAVWNEGGDLVAQLDEHSAGLLYFDVETSSAEVHYISDEATNKMLDRSLRRSVSK